VGGAHDGRVVTGQLSPEDAVGALIRQVARSLGTADDVLAFLAGLFGDPEVRGVDVTLARAVWIAATHPRRRNGGVRIETAERLRPSR
jgi:NAD(P)-dependent dehydrogenase (short-subunit alcohol dehydrogenase family)